MIRRPPRSTQSRSSAASDVYKRQIFGGVFLIFGGFLVTFFMGWVVPGKFNEELSDSKVGIKTTRYLKFMTSWVAPPIIGFGLFISVFDLLKGWVS